MSITANERSAHFSVAFLLAQVGAHAAARFAERLASLDLVPAHAGILRMIAQERDITQRELAERLGMFASRLVILLDELERRGLLERRPSPTDRRSHALQLTAAGRTQLEAIGRLARQHQDDLCASLSEEERATLRELLGKIAEQQSLGAGVHPGYRRKDG